MLKGVQDALQPFMDDAENLRKATAAGNTKLRDKLMEKVQIQLRKLPDLPIFKEADFSGSLNDLQKYMTASKVVDVYEMTPEAIEKLVHYNKLMQGLVLSDSSDGIPRMANGQIGHILPGKNPFHHPSGETHVFEMKDVTTTSNYARLSGTRTNAGCSWSATVTRQSAAVGWYGAFGGAGAVSTKIEAGGAGRQEDQKDQKDQSSTSLKILTEESHANMMQFLVADADFMLSPEFERALIACKDAYVERSKDPTEANTYTYDDHSFKWLLREFGSHMATSARLGGSYYRDATMWSSTEEASAQEQSALRYAMHASASASVSAVAVSPFGGLATKGSVAGGMDVDREKDDYTKKNRQRAEEGVSMHVSITGGMYGTIDDWRNELNSNPDSWRVIDREFSHRLVPVWSLVHKSKLDSAYRKPISDLLRETWERMAIKGEVADTAAKHDGSSDVSVFVPSPLRTDVILKNQVLQSDDKTCSVQVSDGQLVVYQSKDPTKIMWRSGHVGATKLALTEHGMVLYEGQHEVWKRGHHKESSYELSVSSIPRGVFHPSENCELKLFYDGDIVVWRSSKGGYRGQGTRLNLLVGEELKTSSSPDVLVSGNDMCTLQIKNGKVVVTTKENGNDETKFSLPVRDAARLKFDPDGLRVFDSNENEKWHAGIPTLEHQDGAYLSLSNECKLQIFDGGTPIWTDGNFECALYVAGPVVASKDNQVAIVDSLQNYELTFTMELASDWSITGEFQSVFHIGDANGDRLPGIWFSPNINKMLFSQSPSSGNQWYSSSTTNIFAAGQTYEIKVIVENNQMTLYVDGVNRGTASGSATYAATDAAVYVGDPWYDAAKVTLSKICLKPRRA